MHPDELLLPVSSSNGRRNIVTSVCLFVVMVVAATLASWMSPEIRMADVSPAPRLEKVVPDSFGGWAIDRSMAPVTVAPDVQAKLDRIYSQLLTRTYVSPAGYRVMLSIAYGGDQRDGTEVHKPEVCYPAQGFRLLKISEDAISTTQGDIPVKRVITSMGRRHEPVTYWIVVGDQVVSSALEKKLVEIGYASKGLIPDGMLFRVSSIDGDETRAFHEQDEFVKDLISVFDPDVKARLAGLKVHANERNDDVE